MQSYESFKSLLDRFGGHDAPYLQGAFPRMKFTHEHALDAKESRSLRILDIGAHWLHHALMYALDGHTVIAADNWNQLDINNTAIPKVAKEYGITLVGINDLGNPVEFKEIPKNSIDLVLFTEILEHITFNPVRMWSAIYELLSEQGRIIVTTPNYHYLPWIFKESSRVVRGFGSGPSVDHIIRINTFGHHWKLYSVRDMRRYFAMLSPDFTITRVKYFNATTPSNLVKRFVKNLLTLLPIFRDTLFVEIALRKKASGISITPSWE